MDSAVVGLEELDRTQVARAGGKGANLGELSQLDGVRVPAGVCVTTAAFEQAMRGVSSVEEQLDRLTGVDPDDRDAVRVLSGEVRTAVEAVPVPDEVGAGLADALAMLGVDAAYAVRSSATAEDLPGASFAGQQDTYLNVVGVDAILEHVSRCWGSLFTERAVAYRIRNGFDHRQVRMAVVVQRMVDADVSGVLFTADPVTSNRTVTVVEACAGLGDALVSGLVNPATYTVRGEEIVASAGEASGLLTDAQVTRLTELGRRIEAHFSCPQDIEWCLADDDVHVVQSRPITTLFPVPEAGDDENHVYLSVGHQQMMTDAMKPLGLSFWQMTTPRPMAEAGGRLFVDVTQALASSVSRAALLEAMGKADPLMRDALQTVLDRDDFLPTIPDAGPAWAAPGAPPGEGPDPLESDPTVVRELIARNQASIAAARHDIATLSGSALFEFIQADIQALRRDLFDPVSIRLIVGAMDATWWLNEHLQDWLGETNAADTLALSVPNNVTSEMGLALLDVADAVRPHPEVVAFLGQVDDEGFLDDMGDLAGGAAARDAIVAYLDRYGMRCVGEIDITRPRWSERPTALVPLILANVEAFEPGEGPRRFEAGQRDAEAAAQDLLARVRLLADGEDKAEATKEMIDRVRAFIGFREYPKYGMVSRYLLYKRALLDEAGRLAEAGVFDERADAFFLSFVELHDAVRTGQVDAELIARRRTEFRSFEVLTPPRVLTSDGEAVAGRYRRDDLPPGALGGLPVSGGTIEGRARVIHDMSEADLVAGDILVTAYTDPSWSPLFVAAAGLVTEVGGMMTHGAVVAREYGLPAVVGVEGATRLIEDGQRIRVHGTDGFVELLTDP